MKPVSVRIVVVFPWWCKAYIYACAWFAITFGMEPDADKIAAFICRHMRTKVTYADT